MNITLKQVSKEIKGQPVLNNIDLTIDEVGIYAVLGPNGAGKTTMMHILAGLSNWDRGIVEIDGKNPFDHSETLNKISFIQESDNFKPTLRVKDVLQHVKAFYPQLNEELLARLVSEYRLPLNKRLNELSKGMNSALNMSIGLASRAPLTIFDEPYIGMDATARKKLYKEIIEDYVEHPRVILFSTHFIEETEAIFEHTIIVNDGEILLQEPVEDLAERALRISGPKDALANLDLTGQHVLARESLLSEATVAVLCNKGDVPVIPSGCSVQPLSLQEFFIDYTSKEPLPQ
ncbi:ABC transporter ATP-binding protein [Alkalihalobacillus sp. LMS6]|uniref:ATP-binding cassette domain-containing protein n=1 Tax=Alkalihalobacillus sp. LMS6 TaxID=2924034 RepID=UPI0020D074C4|nr:ABC transporter ATP-binding protein [Alkalihalobacillus sp. LMS6]UTR05935.1 ABC transporter ATP-binding protein [Alkalihalobacillus sp. LMS6]